jgi:hypothetical protein
MLMSTLYRINEISKRNVVPFVKVLPSYFISRSKVFIKEIKETLGTSKSEYYNPFLKDSLIIRLTEKSLDKSRLEKMNDLEKYNSI